MSDSNNKFGKNIQDDDTFLSQIEQNIRNKENAKDALQKEVEQRSAEMDRLREALEKNPQIGKRPLSPQQRNTVSKQMSATQKLPTLSDDPRYREYYERLRKDKNKSGDEIASPPPQISSSTAKTTSLVFHRIQLKNGDIVSFDNGSIGIARNPSFEDSTVMFYFLDESGTLSVQEISITERGYKKIGSIPEYLFATQRKDGRWCRDIIVFHLGEFEFVELLKNLTPYTKPTAEENRSEDSITPSKPSAPPAQPSQPGVSSVGKDLSRGQRIRINFSGKAWEAVCWDQDGDDTILAHRTQGHWSLMRLNLERFTDSLEKLDLISADEVREIEQALINQGL